MHASLVALLPLLIALCRGQDNQLELLQNSLSKTAERLREETAAFSIDISRYNKTLRDTVGRKVTRIKNFIDAAIRDVEKLPDDCKGDAEDHLRILRSSSVSDFLHCPSLLPGLMNIFDIFDVSVEIVFDIVVTAVDAFQGLFGCVSEIWPWRIVPCWEKDVSDNFERLVRQTGLYRSLVQQYGENLTGTLEWCWEHSSVRIIEDVSAVVAPNYLCAGRPAPVYLDLYHL